MTDQNRKTLRSFYCRDYLWELFEQMTQEMGCSMDYLINESMRLYARSRDYAPGQVPNEGSPQWNQQGQPSGQSHQGGAPADGVGGGAQHQGGRQGMDHRTFQRVPAVGADSHQQARQGAQGPSRGDQQRSPAGPPPPPPRPGRDGPVQQQQQQQQHGGAALQQSPHGSGYSQQPQQAAGPVYMLFNNNRYVIDSDKFVIGRGSQHTDLTIRDGNISRKHCAILRRNGQYYIKDLDSTNGVEFRGNRIESKRIEEGDVFYLCDYALRFSYHA
ncbi:MAG: FHA domain-containing protein [Persicimonas sp.]